MGFQCTECGAHIDLGYTEYDCPNGCHDEFLAQHQNNIKKRSEERESTSPLEQD